LAEPLAKSAADYLNRNDLWRYGAQRQEYQEKPLTTKDTKEHKGKEGRGRPRAEPAAAGAEIIFGWAMVYGGVERSDRNKRRDKNK
jgi:hypothetical protein